MKNKIEWEKIQSEIIISAKNYDSEKYLFNDQIQKIVTLCQRFSKNSNSNQSNVIGIIGERGSGKSSVLGTTKALLSIKQKEADTPFLESIPKDYYVLDIIDPNDFDKKMNILEMVLAKIYSQLRGDDQSSLERKNKVEIMYHAEKLMKSLA
ncbi:MAG: hypothetical protein ACRC6X_05495, partial [Culicoidibacterales bacterium]